MQEQYASNEGLAIMHMAHAVPIGGAIVQLVTTSGAPQARSGLVLERAISADVVES